MELFGHDSGKLFQGFKSVSAWEKKKKVAAFFFFMFSMMESNSLIVTVMMDRLQELTTALVQRVFQDKCCILNSAGTRGYCELKDSPDDQIKKG